MDQLARQAVRLAAGQEDVGNNRRYPGYQLTYNGGAATTGTVSYGISHWTYNLAEAQYDGGLITQDRNLFEELMGTGLFSNVTAPGQTYAKATMALPFTSYWRLSETGIARNAVDALGDAGINYVSNGEFESDIRGWNTSGSFAGGGTLVSAAQDTSWSNNGLASCRIVANALNPSADPGIQWAAQIPASPGQQFQAGATIHVNAASAGMNYKVYCDFRTAANSGISVITTPVITASGRTQSVVTAPPLTHHVILYVFAQNGGATGGNVDFNIDSVIFAPTATGADRGNLVGDPLRDNSTGAWNTLSSYTAFWLNNGATIVPDDATGPMPGEGQYAGKIVCPATAFTGAVYRLPGAAIANSTCTATVWLRGAVGGEQINVGLGGPNADNTNTNFTLTKGWQQYTISWTATAAEGTTYIVLRSAVASAMTFYANTVIVTSNYYIGNDGNDGAYIGTIQGNLVVNSNFKTDVSGWGAYQNGLTGTFAWVNGTGGVSGGYGVLTVTTNAVTGSNDLGATSTARITVSPNNIYTCTGYSQAVTTARQFQTIIAWYDNTDTLINSVTGPLVNNVTTGFTRAALTATAPATATGCRVYVSVHGPASGEQHYVSAVQLTATPNAVPFSTGTGLVLNVGDALSDDSGAVQLDGMSSYITIPHSIWLGIIGDLTIVGWIKPATIAGGDMTIFSKAGADPSSTSNTPYEFRQHNAGLQFVNGGGATAVRGALVAGQWAHVAVTFSLSTRATILYVNGVAQTTDTLNSGAVADGGGPVTIGKRVFTASPNFFNGSISDLAIGPFVATPAQIAALVAAA